MSQRMSDNRYYLKTTPINSLTVPSNTLSMNGFAINNLADPSTADMAINKRWFDAYTPRSFKLVVGDVPGAAGTSGITITSLGNVITGCTRSVTL